MTIKQQFVKLVTGLSVPQEYCCLDLSEFQNPLSVFVTTQVPDFSFNVTAAHLFLGYKPLIIGLVLPIKSEAWAVIKDQAHICLNFESDTFLVTTVWRGFPIHEGSVARIILKKTETRTLGDRSMVVFEGEYGEHNFLNPAHQFVNQQLARLRRHPPNDVPLPGNLMDQVRIAYSLPRIISVISVSDGTHVNMFPTDLHGPAGKSFYIGSLRVGGKATGQVEHFKNIAIAEIQPAFYKHVYAMGKNHMRELQDKKEHAVHAERSMHFNLPLPEGAIAYRELKHKDMMDAGIHRIHVYEVVSEHLLAQGHSTLAHIHQHYVQWRVDHGLQTNILLR